MADTIHLAQYFKMKAANKPGQAARTLGLLRDAGVNLLAFSGFPRGSQAQFDFVVSSVDAFKAAAKQAKLKTQGPKDCFLIEGDDRRGAGAKLTGALASAKVNVTALQAISAGACGRYAAILFVKPHDVKKAARVLGVR
jgi:hypothetical protein